MSPASRKRKPKKNDTGRQRAPRVSPLAGTMAQALEITSLVQARTWASDLIGFCRATARDSGTDADILVGQLQFEIDEVGGAAGTAAALALSLVGRRSRRAEFMALGEKLALATGSMPAWFAGDLRLRLLAAHSITDALRDHEAIVLEYHDHMLGVVVDHLGLTRLLSVVVHAPGSGVEFVRGLARAVAPDGDPVTLSPAEVSYRLFGPVTMYVDEGPDSDADLPAEQVRKIIGRTALMEAVLADLPRPPGNEEVIERFMAGCGTDEKWSRWWAGFVVGNAEDVGRAATDFGRHFGHTQILKLAREVAVPEEDVPALTEAIQAWARFTDADWSDELPELLEGYAILNARVPGS